MKKYFQGKSIVIFGASQGIGEAIAHELSNYNCHIWLLARNRSKLSEICSYINQNTDSKAFYTICDVTQKEQVENAVEEIMKNFNVIDIAILNAGVSGSEGFENFDSDAFKQIYNVNVYGILHALEFLIPLMKSNGGVIAGVSSLADVRGFPGSAAYSSSKAAASHILEAAKFELMKFNIRVLTIKPGFVKTNMTDRNNFPMPFMIPANKAAKHIVHGIRKEKQIIAFPTVTKIAARLAKVAPNCIFNLIFRKKYFKF